MLNKYVNIYAQVNRAVQDAYALLTANIHFSNSTGDLKTVTIISCTPKVGTTTVAINLAISLARSGWKTLMVDADMRKPGTYKRLVGKETQGENGDLDINIREFSNNTTIPNLSYLSYGSGHDNPIELLCSPKFSEFIREARREYDFVLFDTPALSSVIDGALIASKSDRVILVAEMGKTKKASLTRAAEQLEKAQANILGVVINNIVKRDYVKYAESYNYFERFK
ncbi:MAG: CpsD/CapB family tyrosine-protein kinase [Syntrophomonadaceae bacterium]